MTKPREFWINVDELPHYYATDKKEEPGDIFVREVLPIDWDKVAANYDGPEFYFLQIQELVERALEGDL